MDRLCPAMSDHALAKHHGESVWENTHWEPGNKIPAQSVNNKVVAWQVGWLEAWGDPPLTCSFCGGSRPLDVMRLIAAGWEIEPTTKGYKYYIHPPGTVEYRRKLMEAFRSGQLTETFQQPVPPVKLYTYHCSEEELQRINHLLRTTPESESGTSGP